MSTPSYLPSLGTMKLIDFAVQKGNGAAASATGQTYDVYRLGPNSDGSVFDAAPVYTGFPMYVEKATRRQIENDTFNLNVYVGFCDNEVLQLGDVLVETGFQAEAGNIFTFAQRRPVNWKFSSVFVRTASSISITRPQPLGGQSGQQPISGAIEGVDYAGVDKANEWGLVLQSGTFFFTGSGETALAGVPADLSQLNRIRDGSDIKIPTALYREHFCVWIPLVIGANGGSQIQELDIFNFPNSDRYIAASVFTSEQTGLGGYVAICEKAGT